MAAEHPVTPLGVRLLQAQTALLDGEIGVATEAYGRLVADAPQLHQAHYGLASSLWAAGDRAGGDVALDTARVLHTTAVLQDANVDVARCRIDGAHALAVANALYGAGFVAVASLVYGHAAGAGDISVRDILGLGLSLQHQGRAEDAIEIFRIAAERAGAPAVAEFLLPVHFAADDGVARHAAEALAWARRYAPSGPRPDFANARDTGRRLRVGYVCPSFGNNQARQFLTPLLEAHDPAAVEVFLYPQDTGETVASRPGTTTRPIGKLNDDAALELIRGDRIDILVDCWGHNANGRLPLFARRPAPVQVSWLNYMQTTGLEAIDYTLHSDTVDQPGMQDLFVETIWRMGLTSAAFRPDRAPSLAPTPMARNGYATFGSFNHPSKLTDATVALWSRILRRAPQSKLVLKYRYFTDPVLQAVTAARFAAHGVDPLQLDFRGHSLADAYASEFDEIDLALDPTPAPGGTTSLEALAHGVPVLTLAGDTYYARIGVELLAGAGLPDLIAYSHDAYVDTAVEVTANADRLQALRDRVAPGFAAAPYRDEQAIARRFETAYREMFQIWCDAPTAQPDPSIGAHRATLCDVTG